MKNNNERNVLHERGGMFMNTKKLYQNSTKFCVHFVFLYLKKGEYVFCFLKIKKNKKKEKKKSHRILN